MRLAATYLMLEQSELQGKQNKEILIYINRLNLPKRLDSR
ncbi:hypothetical protein PCC8801_0530 [Rippkaea orientalis PCC 8801]|uniref:Uncharacterized protein n=1 Tax=Rippkaea orientalis (strain PCC 8801 / RF-1) TaxID=41431 RepID=B7JVQ0_RIPO1|nr:hypothetical protein PCC8801_0530 [Rippkaea orientalis PCC 8801]